MNNIEKSKIYKSAFEENLTDATKGLLGFPNKKINITDKQKKDLQQEFKTDFLCYCVGCQELAKLFAVKSPDIKEQIIFVSMNDAEKLIK